MYKTMADTSSPEKLTPLDQFMPRTYISSVFVFKASLTPKITERLQDALEKLLKQVPWLAGEICQSNSAPDSPLLGIRWNAAGSPTLVDKGTISASFDDASSRGMPGDIFPADFWNTPGVLDDTSLKSGVPVFAASIFGFADQGMGLCVSISHNVVDAFGFGQIMKMWAQNISDDQFDFSVSSQTRLECLSNALSHESQQASTLSTDELLTRHPEYSLSPPAFPEKWPSCTSKLFAIWIGRIDPLKSLLHAYMTNPPTTNTIICALIWTSITRIRAQHNPSLTEEGSMSRLATAVNARQRIGGAFSDSEFLGNAVFYGLSALPAKALSSSNQATTKELAHVCEHVAQSQSVSAINTRHIGEVVQLMERVKDPRSLFVGWDLFGCRDLTIASWADMGLYDFDFGAGVGKPDFVRLPYMEADGVAIVLPRKRNAQAEVLEVVIMLRRDHMEALEKNAMWNALFSSA